MTTLTPVQPHFGNLRSRIVNKTVGLLAATTTFVAPVAAGTTYAFTHSSSPSRAVQSTENVIPDILSFTCKGQAGKTAVVQVPETGNVVGKVAEACDEQLTGIPKGLRRSVPLTVETPENSFGLVSHRAKLSVPPDVKMPSQYGETSFNGYDISLQDKTAFQLPVTDELVPQTSLKGPTLAWKENNNSLGPNVWVQSYPAGTAYHISYANGRTGTGSSFDSGIHLQPENMKTTALKFDKNGNVDVSQAELNQNKVLT